MAALWTAAVLSMVSHLLVVGSVPICSRMTDAVCGKQIVQSIFHGQGQVSDTCCDLLIQRGRKCHDELLEARLVSGGYESNATAILKRSNEVWNGCVAVAPPTPSKTCNRMGDAKCGHEIVARVFHKEGQVSDKCCAALLALGKECHDKLVEARIVAGGYEKNATLVLAESKDVWNKCASMN